MGEEPVHGREPQGDAPGTDDFGDPDQLGITGQRGAQTEPRKGEIVGKVRTQPFAGGPGYRKGEPDRHAGPMVHAVEGPGRQGDDEGQDEDGSEVRQNRELREPDERHQDPIEKEPKVDETQQEPPAESRVSPLPSHREIVDEEGERHERYEGGEEEMKRRKGYHQEQGGDDREDPLPLSGTEHRHQASYRITSPPFLAEW